MLVFIVSSENFQLTSQLTKVLIQRQDRLYCQECGRSFLESEAETHESDCCWYEPVVDPLIEEMAENPTPAGQRTADQFGYIGHLMSALHNPEAAAAARDRGEVGFVTGPPVVPIYGWVCSRCQRCYNNAIMECPHCQPGACGGSRLDGGVGCP